MEPTSNEAYRQCVESGKVTRLGLEVAKAMADHGGPISAGELYFKYFQGKGGKAKQIDSIRPRLAQLERKGWVRFAGIRADENTGFEVKTWELSVPTVSPISKPTKREVIEALQREVNSLRADSMALRMLVDALTTKLQSFGVL